MSLVDVRALPLRSRLAAADRIRTLTDFALPTLDWFNSAPCEAHPTLADGQRLVPPCRRCGVKLRQHQRVGVAWLYTRGKGLIADQVGLGKTAQAAGLIAAVKQNHELDTRKAVVICRAAALDQWFDELRRFLPRLHIVAADGSRNHRHALYRRGFDVLACSAQIFLRDHETLTAAQPIGTLVVDDVDPLRNPDSRTSYAIKQLAARCERVAVLTGTPLQKRLPELHSVLELIGGLDVFGPLSSFTYRYVRHELDKEYSSRAGRYVYTKKVTGYQNLDEFITKLAPFTLRRTPGDITDVDLPVIQPHNVHLDLYPSQRARYDELRQGVLRIIKAEGAKVRQVDAMPRFMYGQKICDGLHALGEPDAPGSSSKLDWIENVLVDGDLSDEKVVVYCHFQNTAVAIMDRLRRHNVGHVVIWGREPRRAVRGAAVARFWDDPTCRVLIGTDSIEQSLNLQVSRHLINVDQIMNPARMTQLAGRVRRDGSAYGTVYVHNLLTRHTQEDGYLDALAREQALADHIWDESNQLFSALSPLALLQLIGGSAK